MNTKHTDSVSPTIVNQLSTTDSVEAIVDKLLREARNDFDLAKASAGREVSFSFWFKEEVTKAIQQQVEEAVKQEVHATLAWVNVILGYKHPSEVRRLVEEKLSELETPNHQN